MAYTFTFTSDAIGNAETIIANTVCRRIRVRQNDLDAAVINYYTYQPATLPTPGQSAAILHPAINICEFRAPGNNFFQPGDRIADISTVSGSVVFCQEEDM